MRSLFLTVLLGLTSAYGQEKQSVSEPTAEDKFQQEFDSGKEFPLAPFPALVKLGSGDLRCGEYFLLTHGTVKSTGKTVTTMFLLVKADKQRLGRQFMLGDYDLRISSTKQEPTMFLQKQKATGIEKIVLTVPVAYEQDARMCLYLPDLPRTAKK